MAYLKAVDAGMSVLENGGSGGGRGSQKAAMEYEAAIAIPDGKQALYFTYAGTGTASLASFILE